MMHGRLGWILGASVVLASCGTATSAEDAGSDAPAAACRHASDCLGLACIAGACRPVVSCTTSRMCPGLLCNTSLGTCAECVTDADCAHGLCSAGVCEASVRCASDRDCTSMDEVCDRVAMVCVECTTNADCTAPRVCAVDHSCATECAAGSTACDGGLDAASDDAGIDATTPDGGTDGGSDAGPPPAWEDVSGAVAPLYGGFPDRVPAGSSSLYTLPGASIPPFARYDISARTWAPLSGPALVNMRGFFSGPAWIGSALYVIFVDGVYRYDIAAGSWTTLSSVDPINQSQNAHDDAGHVYAVTSDDRIVTYTVASSTLSYQAFGRSQPIAAPRVAWDASSSRLYVAPSLLVADLWAFDPATGISASVAPVPGGSTAPTFCGDRAGHLYATACTPGDASIWRYDATTNVWSAMPDLPFAHGQNGACTVTEDGYLYVSADAGAMARIRVR